MYNAAGMEKLAIREEIANSISHGLGLLLAIIAVPILVLAAVRAGSVHFIVGASVFGGTTWRSVSRP